MKRLYVLIAIIVLLTGCAKQTDYETVSDELQAVSNTPSQISVRLPESAAVPVMEDDEGGKLYLCDQYSITSQTERSGDLSQTIRQITGYSPQTLNIVSTQENGIKRYDCVWTSAGEGNIQTCRAAILDDGSYHYILSAMGDAAVASTFSNDWQMIFDSFTIMDTD